MGRGYQRGNLGVHRGKASGNSKPFPSLCSSIHQPGPPKRAGAAENWPHACLPDGRGGDEKRGQGISIKMYLSASYVLVTELRQNLMWPLKHRVWYVSRGEVNNQLTALTNGQRQADESALKERYTDLDGG